MEEERNTHLKEDEKKENKPIKEQIIIINMSKQIDYILKKENNKELEKLKEDLQKYKQEIENKINFKTPIENESFKRVLYSNLEPLLFESIYIPIPLMRNEKIRQLYKWYIGKVNKFNSLDHISIKTDKREDEIFLKEELQSDDILVLDEQYEQREFKNHRTDIEGFEPPKDRIKKFTLKKIYPPKALKRDNKSRAGLKFNLERFKGRVGSANSSITLQSTFYATTTGHKWFSNSGLGVNEILQPIQPKKEIKNSYSYMRPNYDYSRLVIEKEIAQEKNREVANKRNREEIKNYIIEYGRNRANFKEEREMKCDYANLISHYDKTLTKTIQSPKTMRNKTQDIQVDTQFEKLEPEKERETVLYSKVQNTPSINAYRNKNTKDYKIYTSLSKEDSKKQMLNEQKDKTNAIKADTLTMAMTYDNIFATRKIAAKMCNVNEVNSAQTGYMHHYTPLSAFDAANYNDNINQKYHFPQMQKCRPSTVAQYISLNYCDYKYDLLSLRKTMEKFKQNEIQELEKTLKRVESCSQLQSVKKLFEPINIPQYPTSFLPRTKSSLLHMPPGLLGKKGKSKSKGKSKGKKKKKKH